MKNTEDTFRRMTDAERYTVAWCQCGHAPELHGEDGQCTGAKPCDAPPVEQCSCRSFRPGPSARAQFEKYRAAHPEVAEPSTVATDSAPEHTVAWYIMAEPFPVGTK